MRSIIDILKDKPSLVSEIARQRDTAQKIIQNIDVDKGIYVYGQKYTISIYPLDAVIWLNKYITLIESFNDVISFDFGGCVMANFELNGRLYAAHIHNADENHQAEDARINWIQYVKSNNITVQSMFRPGNESLDILNKINSQIQIWGVCTPLGKNYSLILNKNEDHLISIRENITPTNYTDILKLVRNENYYGVRNRWNHFWSKQKSQIIFENNIPESLSDRK